MANNVLNSQGVVFSSAAATRISAAVLAVERMRPGAMPPVTYPTETSFWAMISSMDLWGQHYSFFRVAPHLGTDQPEIEIVANQGRWQAVEPLIICQGAATEANAARGVAPGTIVKMELAGFDPTSKAPRYVFAYQQLSANLKTIQPHDHRDNANGGFAFAAFHPGTRLPQTVIGW